jgi:hypothetical protein
MALEGRSHGGQSAGQGHVDAMALCLPRKPSIAATAVESMTGTAEKSIT